MPLYLLLAETDESEDQSLVLWATSPAVAIEAWAEYYEHDAMERFESPEQWWGDTDRAQIYEVPLPPAGGMPLRPNESIVLDWDLMRRTL